MGSEDRQMNSRLNTRSAVALLALGLFCGCAADNAAQTKQTSALDNPGDYKQQMDSRGSEGGVTNTDNFGKDFHDFFDP